jgi:integrase
LSERVRCQKCVYRKHAANEVCSARFVSPSTVNRELTTLKKLLNVALVNRKIRENPMRFVEMLGEPPPRDQFLTDEEKQRLYQAIRGNRQLLAIVLIALTTGWRKGQILSVKKSDLDAKHKAVQVIKSKKSPARKVPVSNYTFAVFESLANEAKTEYLFFNEKTGKRLGDFKKAWKTALHHAGIDNFRFHDLRHTVATDLYDMGAGEFMVQTALGHADIKTTRGYVHVKNQNLRDQMENLADGNKPSSPTIITPWGTEGGKANG